MVESPYSSIFEGRVSEQDSYELADLPQFSRKPNDLRFIFDEVLFEFEDRLTECDVDTDRPFRRDKTTF
jgi:hypothetical protein